MTFASQRDAVRAATALGAALVTLNVMGAIQQSLLRVPHQSSAEIEDALLIIHAAVLAAIDDLPCSKLSADYQQMLRILVQSEQPFVEAYVRNDLVAMRKAAGELQEARLVTVMAEQRLAQRLGLLE